MESVNYIHRLLVFWGSIRVMKKETMVRLTAIEFLVIFMLSIAAVDTYGCSLVFIWSIAVSLLWYIIFFIANGVIS